MVWLEKEEMRGGGGGGRDERRWRRRKRKDAEEEVSVGHVLVGRGRRRRWWEICQEWMLEGRRKRR